MPWPEMIKEVAVVQYMTVLLQQSLGVPEGNN